MYLHLPSASLSMVYPQVCQYVSEISQTSRPASPPGPSGNPAEHGDGHLSAQSSRWPAMAEKGTARLRHKWTPRLSHQEQASIIISLAHTLKGLRQEANEINLQVTELYWELSPAQWEKAQNGCKESYSMAQQKEITSLQEALIAAGHQPQHENPPDRTCKENCFTQATLTRSLTWFRENWNSLTNCAWTQVNGTLLHIIQPAVQIPSILYTDTKGWAKAFCLTFHKSASWKPLQLQKERDLLRRALKQHMEWHSKTSNKWAETSLHSHQNLQEHMMSKLT